MKKLLKLLRNSGKFARKSRVIILASLLVIFAGACTKNSESQPKDASAIPLLPYNLKWKMTYDDLRNIVGGKLKVPKYDKDEILDHAYEDPEFKLGSVELESIIYNFVDEKAFISSLVAKTKYTGPIDGLLNIVIRVKGASHTKSGKEMYDNPGNDSSQSDEKWLGILKSVSTSIGSIGTKYSRKDSLLDYKIIGNAWYLAESKSLVIAERKEATMDIEYDISAVVDDGTKFKNTLAGRDPSLNDVVSETNKTSPDTEVASNKKQNRLTKPTGKGAFCKVFVTGVGMCEYKSLKACEAELHDPDDTCNPRK